MLTKTWRFKPPYKIVKAAARKTGSPAGPTDPKWPLLQVTLRQAATDLLRPRRPEALLKPLMLGREREAAAAFDGIWAGGPVGFHAACGYGKQTLLANVAATALPVT